MEVIAAAKTNAHAQDAKEMVLSGFIWYVGEGRGQGAAPRQTGPGHFAGGGLLQAESTAGMLLCCSGAAAREDLILDNLLQHNEVDNPLWSRCISRGLRQLARARTQAQP